MVIYYYEIAFIISFILSTVYVYIQRKHFDVNITAVFILVPITNLAYVFYSNAYNIESTIVSIKFIYLGGCFLTFFISTCVLKLCGIQVNRLARSVAFTILAIIYAFVLTIGKKKYFYKNIILKRLGGRAVYFKEYGPVHTLFYIVVAIFFIICMVAIIYSLIKKKQISNTILILLYIPVMLSVVGYFGNAMIGNKVELLPATYVFAQFVYILIVRRMKLYNVSDMVIESMIQTGDTGFISVDFRNHYLGANETAKNIIPELKELSIDQRLNDIPELKKTLCHWIDIFKNDNSITRNLFRKSNGEGKEDDQVFIVDINYLYDDKRKCGYQIFLSDDTQNQKYITLMDKYNTELEEEVQKKTQHIVEMHNNLILSMATMVESRDNSTGGHIRRTSECVRILINEICQDEAFVQANNLTDEFCQDLIKAAPMHDLGKVAVDDVILRKPGRFTPEEFEKMKLHAAEGARIVHEILKDTDDESFKKIAENVAHYHHERMDGSGYPDGLKGEQIPLEARIMAIADVYDALVSKRVYKESMSFEQADKIMMESMGKHFDKRLEPYYVSARPKLEEYYESL